MDEKQLQLLFDRYGKQQGFKDISEFKSLIEDDNARKIFFEHNNTEMGFVDQKEFDNLLGLKKKAQSGTGSGSGLAPKPQSKSISTSTSTIIQGTQPWPTPNEKPFEKRAKDPNQPSLPAENGKRKTHRMASAEVDGKFIAYPTIVQRGPGLQELSDDDAFEYAMQSGEFKEFKTEKEAQEYAAGGYKKGTPLAEVITPKVKTLNDFNAAYDEVYTPAEFQGKEVSPAQKADYILDIVSNNIADANAVPKLKNVIKAKIDRELGYVEAAKIGEEEQEQKAKQEYELWSASDKGKTAIEKVKNELTQKYEAKNQELAQAYQQGKISKPDAEKALQQLNQGLNQELNQAVGGLWQQEFDTAVKPKLQEYFKTESERRFQQAAMKDRVISNRALYTMKSIANSEKFKQMNFDDKKRVIAATWDATRVMLEKKGYKEDFVQRYKEQFFSEFVMQASRTPKGDVTSYGVRDWAQDALKEIEAEKAEVEKKKTLVSKPNIGGTLGYTGQIEDYDMASKQELQALLMAEEQIKATLARPELGGGTLLEGIGQGFEYGKNYPIPYLKSVLELTNNLRVYDINKKIKNGVETTDGEKLLLHSLGMDNAYQADAKPSFAFGVGEGATVSIPYMIDMMGGNWAAAPARVAIKEAILKGAPKLAEKAAFKYGVAQPISVIVGEMARTAVDPARWGASFVQHMNPEVRFAFGMDVDTKSPDSVSIDEMVAVLDRSQYDLTGQKTGKNMDPVEAFAYAFLDNLKENVSERIGGALGGEAGEALVKALAKNNDWAKRVIISAMLRKNGGLNPNSFQRTMRELKDASGLNGMLGENIEEYASAVADDFMYNRQFGASFTPEFLKETAAVTGLIQIPMQVIGLSAKFINGKNYKIEYRKGDGELAEIEIPLEMAQQAFSPKGKVEMANWLNSELGKTDLTPEERLAVMQNVQSKMYWNEARAKARSVFGVSYDALNDDKKKEVRDMAYKAIMPFIQTKDQMLLESLKRNESKKQPESEVEPEPLTSETETEVPQMPLTADEEGTEGVEGDPEQELNDIANKIQMGLALTDVENQIVQTNKQWFDDMFKGTDVEMPEPPPIKPTGLGQEQDEVYQRVMGVHRNNFLKEKGISLDEFNAMPANEKSVIEDAYAVYLNEIQEAGEEQWVEEKKKNKGKKQKAPFKPEVKKDFLAEELQGSRFTMQSIYDLSDKNNFENAREKGQTYALNWGTSRKGAQTVDQYASFAKDDEQSFFYGKDEQDIIDDITNFIKENPGGARSYINQRLKEIEKSQGIDRDVLVIPEQMDVIDEFVNNFSDEELDDMEAWLLEQGNLDAVAQDIEEWLSGDALGAFGPFGGFTKVFGEKYFGEEGVPLKETALAKKLKQLIDGKQDGKGQKSGPGNESGTGKDNVEEVGDGKGEKEGQEVIPPTGENPKGESDAPQAQEGGSDAKSPVFDNKNGTNESKELEGLDLDDFDMTDLDVLGEMDLFGGTQDAKGKSDFRKEYEEKLAEAKKQLKITEKDLRETKARAKSEGVEGNTLAQILRPKQYRYEMALKQLDLVRLQERNVRRGEDAQQTLFEGNVSGFLKKDLTPEQLQVGKRFISQFFDKGVYAFPKIAAVVKAKAGEQKLYDVLPALVKVYMGEMASVEDDVADQMSSRAEVRKYVEDFIENLNNKNESTDNEQTGSGGQSNNGLGQEDVQPQPDGDGQGGGQGVSGTQNQGGQPNNGSGVSNAQTPSDGEGGNTGVSGSQPGSRGGTGSGSGPRGSNISGGTGVSNNVGTRPGTTETNDSRIVGQGRDLSFDQKLQQQQQAESIEVVLGDAKNIAETLPIQLNSQQEDVLKAEKALFGDDRKAVLFTNGTGTGKTSTALGIVKRQIKAGKRRILILTPKQGINDNFVREGVWFGLEVHNLNDTQDTGQDFNVVVTTYANFRENEGIQNQDWDMIVADESDEILSNQKGEITSSLRAFRVAAKHRTELRKIAQNRVGSVELRRLEDEVEEAEQALKEYSGADFRSLMEMRERLEKLKENRDEERKKFEKVVDAEVEKLKGRTKVVFMSATPFASAEALDYAEDFLFEYPKDKNGYPSQNQFMAENFGWQFNHYGKLKKKSAGPEVDKGYLERAFHEKLKAEGVLFTRTLESDYDYSRHFLLIEDDQEGQGIGRKIDEGISILRHDFKLGDLVDKKFNYLYTMRLLEAYKAKEIIPEIRKMIADGKKVVVFHNYNEGLPSHPFDFSEEDIILAARGNPTTIAQIKQKIAEFDAKHPEFSNLDMNGLINPIETFQEAFGEEVVLYNGQMNAKQKATAKNLFNENPTKNVFLANKAAGKSGISLHDTEGLNQRYFINLGLPIMSNDAIQAEGRIYRVGNMSDAVFIYPVLHTNFERMVWANKSAPRAGTSENFALGEEARGLEVSFKEGYRDADTGIEEPGKGGKTKDKQLLNTSPYQISRIHYAVRQKRRRGQTPEGVDYYPTPEPLGFKMVEWADIKPGNDVLEPSSGSGSISRYVPEQTNLDMIEPNDDLRSVSAMLGHKNSNTYDIRFEELSINNKYDRIVMNPPFGVAGKTAMDHVAKAFVHLKDGGRVVALVPQGKMDERLKNFLFGDQAPEDAVLRAVIKLPAVTFEKAGTNVMTQVVIIDRIKDKATRERIQALGGSSLGNPNTMLNGLTDIGELFDEIEEMGVPLAVSLESSPSPVQAQGSPSVLAEVKKNYHAKLRRDNWVVVLNGPRLGSERYAQVNAKAKTVGQGYSSFNRNGAIPGFQFDKEENANAFAKWINDGYAEDPKLMSDASDMVPTVAETEFRDNLTAALTDSFEGVVDEVVVAPNDNWDNVFQKPSTGEVMGAFWGDKIYLDPRVARPETPIHEFGHAFTKLLSQYRPDVLETGLKLVEGSVYLSEVQQNPAYSNLSDAQQREEALVRAIAAKGVAMAANEKKGFAEWLKSFWAAIKDIVGLTEVSPEQLSNMTLDEYAKAAVKTMFDKSAIQSIANDKLAKNIVASWYSRLNAVVTQKGNTMTGKQWSDWAEARANEGLFDREELYWTGISDWFEENKDNRLKKEEVLNFLANNKVEIAEKILEDKNIAKDPKAKKVEALKLWFSEFGYNEMYWNYDGVAIENTDGEVISFHKLRDAYDRIKARDASQKDYDYIKNTLFPDPETIDNEKAQSFAKQWLEKYEELNAEWELLHNQGGLLLNNDYGSLYINSTRLDYTSPDLSNKKEIVLYAENYISVPEGAMLKQVAPYNQNDDIHFGAVTDGRALVWLRFGDQTTEDGRKVMVIDEIQSQRHEAGRDKGYEGVFTITELNGDKIEGSPVFNTEKEAKDWIDIATRDEKGVKIKAYRIKEGRVPNAPFKKTYTDLAVKRALMFAAENGYDAVAWNTGEQVNRRFSLANQIDGVSVVKGDEFRAGQWNVVAYRNNPGYARSVLADDWHTPESLKEMYGTELAKKIMEVNDESDLRIDETAIGGEPMKKYYGSVKEGRIGDIGKSVEKFVKKYDPKLRVQPIEVDMDLAKGFDSGMSVAITPELKQSMQAKGVPLMQVEQPKVSRLDAAVNDLKAEWNKSKQLGITPNQNDPTGLILAAKFIKVVGEYVRAGITNFKDLAKSLGEGSEQWIRAAYEKVKTKLKAIGTDSLVLAVFGQGASKAFVDAVSAAKLMPARTVREFRANMDALAAATNDKEQQQIFAALKAMADQNLKSAQQFIDQVGDVKPNVQIVLNRNGVPQYVYNDRGMGPLTDKYFSISGRVKEALNSIGIPVREKRIPRALGVYYVKQKYVATRSLMEVFTAIHEGMHHIDQTNGIADSILNSRDKDLIEELKKLYQALYANAKPTHPTSLQVIEGLAVFMNEYLADPILMAKDYPEIFNKVFSSSGQFHNSMITKLYDAMANIMDGVKQVSPVFSTGLRMADAQAEIKNGFRTKSDWVMPKLADVGFKRYMALQVDTGSVFREMDELADTANSNESLEIAYFTNMQSSPIASTWLNGKQLMPIIQKDGTYKFEQLSVNDILKELGRIAVKVDKSEEFVRDVFNQYLVNRRARGDYNRMVDAKNDYDMYMANFSDPDQMTDLDKQIAKQLLEDFVKFRTIVDNDNFDIRQVNAGIAAFEKEFKDATALFDRINANLLEVAKNTGLISDESYREWSKNKDYASFQRYIHDDLMVSGGNSGGGTMGQFKSRTGSSGKAFMGPMEAMILHIPKTIMKGYQNMFWMKFAKFVDNHGEDMGISKNQLNQDFIRVPKTPVMIGGVPTFHHLENRGYVSFYTNGSKQFYEAADWIKALATTLSPEDMNGAWEKILFAGANVFGLMTTAANPEFALRNFTIDQISAFVNSQSGKRDFLGVGDAVQFMTQWRTVLNELGMKVDTPQGVELLKKYLALAGDRFNASKAFSFDRNETIGEIVEKVAPKKTVSYRVKQGFDAAIDVLAAPVNATEIMTRFAEFKRLIDLGYDDSTALFGAANVSAPFYRRGYGLGKAGRVAYRSHVYWNASLQALAKNIESIKSNPKRGAGLAATLAVIGAYSIIQVFNGGGDDDDIAAMANKPAEEFGKYVFIWTGEDWMRVRVPEAIAVITGPSQMAAFSYAYEMHKNRPFTYSPSQYFTPLREALPGGLKQLEGMIEGAVTLDEKQIGSNALQMLPTIAIPTVTTAINQRVYPTLLPIVSGKYATLESKYQYNKYTSDFAKWMGQKFGVSPMKTDYFLKAQLGTNARFALEQMAEEKRPLLQNPYKFATKNVWQRGREYGLFLQVSNEIEKHKNSFNQILEESGVDMEEIKAMFRDEKITPADYLKSQNMKRFKQAYPEQAKHFEESYMQYRFSENLRELSYIVGDLDEMNSISPEQKLQWFELIYAFNRNLPMQYVQAKEFVEQVKDNKNLNPSQKSKVKKMYSIFLAQTKPKKN